jgi:16S rRNA (uracil1498-N3)-methyltransferase
MPYFLIDPETIRDKLITITGGEFRHIAYSLRLRRGDEINCIDGHGWKYGIRLDYFDSHKITATVIAKTYMEREPKIVLSLAQAIPKQRRMETVLEKGTELGVRKFHPLVTENSTVILSGDRLKSKMRKWNNCIRSSTLQCGRALFPDLSAPVHIMDIVKESKDRYDVKLIACIRGDSFPGKALRTLGSGSKILLVIGPEGGFSEKEVSTAVGKGFIRFGLGERIMRTETAGIVASALVMYECGEMKNASDER